MTATAQHILTRAHDHIHDRASTYDSDGGCEGGVASSGERSMARTVATFNAFHGTGLTEAQGWHFMQILKDVRLFTSYGYHADSAEDCAAYAALKAEALSAQWGVNPEPIPGL